VNFHYTIKTLPEHLRDPVNWPFFDASGFEQADKERYEKRRRGIEAYLKGATRRAAAKIAGCSESELGRLFRRCVTVTKEMPFVGWKGLDKDFKLMPWGSAKRKPGAPPAKGYVGEFLALLDDPMIRGVLDNAIEGRSPNWTMPLSRLQRQEVFDIFLLACAARPNGSNLYPLGEGNKSKAKRSVYRYIDQALSRGINNYSIWFGHAATTRMRTGTGSSSFRLVTQPLDLLRGDAHCWDVAGTILIESEHGPKPVPISRLWIFLLLDDFSTTSVGYSVSYEIQISAETIERAFVSAQTPWVQRELSHGLEYKKGACLPAGNVKGIDACYGASVKLDNYSAHYSKLVQEDIRTAMGFHMHFGGVGTWWSNARLERFFETLEQKGIHRLPSSLGSGTQDPMRPKNPIKAAIDNNVDWKFVVDLVEVLVTGENASKSGGRSGMSGIEIMRNHAASESMAFLPRIPMAPHATAPRIGWVILKLRIAGSRESGRNPYVEHHGRFYSHGDFKGNWDLLDQFITVHIRKSDIYVEAFYEGGQYIGPLERNGGRRWANLDYETLKQIRRERNYVDAPEEELVAKFQKNLAEQAALDAKKRPNKISKAATEAAEFERRKREAEDAAIRSGNANSHAEQADDEQQESHAEAEAQTGTAPAMKHITPQPVRHAVINKRGPALETTNVFAFGKLGGRK